MSWASNSEQWGKPQRKNKGTQEDLQPKKWFFLKPNKSSSKREREGQGEVEGGKERRGKRREREKKTIEKGHITDIVDCTVKHFMTLSLKSYMK